MKDFINSLGEFKVIWGIIFFILLVGVIWTIVSSASYDYSQEDEWETRSDHSRP